MQKVLVFLSGNEKKDKEAEELLKTVSEKISPIYTFECVWIFEGIFGLSLPYVFYKGIRFFEIIGIREFVRYVTSEKSIVPH